MVVENYQINEPFLKDVLGTFYKGFEVKTEQSVIIHCVDDTLANDPEFVDLYNAYLAEAAQLNIPNFAKAISSGNEADILYTIYPDADLIPLKKILSQNNILSIFDAPNLLEKISLSIRALHIEGIIHGALSPESIFVDSKLERFEIFNAGSEKLVRCLLKKYPGNLQKKSPFLSPEILNPDAALQRQSDIYSLGVLFYTFLVGNTPWPDTDIETPLSKRDSIVPPSLHRLEIPDVLDSLILEALETNPEKRSANLTLFLSSLTEAKSNILASFTPTSALIYGQLDAPTPTGTGESHKSVNEDDDYEEIKTEPNIGIIEIEEPEDNVQNVLKASKVQSDESGTLANSQIEDSPISHEQDEIIPNADERSQGDIKNIINGESSALPEEDDNYEEIKTDTNLDITDIDKPEDSVQNTLETFQVQSDESETSANSQTEDSSIGQEQDEIIPNADERSQGDTKDIINGESGISTEEMSQKEILAEQEEQNVRDNSAAKDYRQQLLNHENDFFITEPGEKSTHFENGLTKLKPDAIGRHPHGQKPDSQASGLENKIEIDEFLPEKKVTPEIYTDGSSVEQEKGLKFKTHQTSFPALQINEFDDRLSFKNYREKAQKSVATKPLAQPSDAQQNQKIESQKKIHPNELDDFDEKTATATEEYAAEPINNKRKRSKKRFMRNVLKKVGIPLVSILSIYLLVLVMIDLGIPDGIKNIKENIKNAPPKAFTNQPNIRSSQKGGNATEQNDLQSRVNSQLTQNPNFSPIKNLTQSINNNVQAITNLPLNPLSNIKQRKRVTILNSGSTNQIRQNSTPPPVRKLVEPEIANEAQLIIAVRNNTTPLVANVYLDGKLYGKTNNQGILSLPSLQKNQSYLLRIDKSGFEMFAREINLTRAGIETIDANLKETKVAINSAQLNSLKKRRIKQIKNLDKKNSPKTKSSQEEFGTVNVLLNNTEPIRDAFIHINGQLWQGNNYQAPAELQLPSGTYVIEIQKDGYISAPPSFTLDLLNGDYKTISFILTAF